MIIATAKKKIDKYLDSGSSTPIIVDVSDKESLDDIISTYNVGSNRFIDASAFCGYDGMPQMDKLEDNISHRKVKVFLTGLSSFLKLKGANHLKRALQSLLDLQLDGKLVIITYQAGTLLSFKDPRLKASGRIIIVDSKVTPVLPVVFFVAPDLAEGFELCLDGLNSLPKLSEGVEIPEIYIKTKHNRLEFTESLFDIRSYSTTYEILAKAYTEIASLDSNYGTDEQWAYLKTMLDKYGDWQSYIQMEFGGTANLPQNIGNYNNYSSEQQWAYFIALCTCGAANSDYLSRVLGKSHTQASFLDNLYTTILEIPIKSKAFSALYKERKQILKSIQFPIDVISNFCKQVSAKKENALFYLTDATVQEKELIIDQIYTFSEQWSKKELESILSFVFPDLQVYLSAFNYQIPLLTEYFNQYKYCKVINRISPGFMDIVIDQAKKREYNSILQPRAYELSKMDITGTKMYFVDALGVEYMSFIQDRLFNKKLDYQVSYARCDLPSITSLNKDFVDTFKTAGCPVIDIKDLDSLKHDGTSKYNYEITKLPIHIIEEFSIIDKVLKSIEEDLHVNGYNKVFIIADHGASRLAVINEMENKWELAQKGLHSGRCCPVTDVSEQIEFATEENGYWCIANYDRFKGGRKANVEVHGGASLEEVVIPIIAITKGSDKPKCFIDEDFRVVTASFKTNPIIRLFVAKDSDLITVVLKDKVFKAVKTDQKYYYDIEMPGVKKGKYTIDVYEENSLIAQGLSFEVKSAGASENRYF